MRLVAFLSLLILLALVGCGRDLSINPVTPVSTASPTPILPTPTPEPAIAVVNGERIPLAEFQAELQRYLQAQEALGNKPTEEEARKVVLEALVDEVLLAQAARQAGFSLTESALQSRVEALAAQVGGEQALRAWEQAQGFSEASFRHALQRAAAASWMRDQIVAKVPTQAEQVHVRQILFYNETEAQQVLAQLQSGADFERLAWQYDPLSGGDLGWFPRGYLFEPTLEEAAFRLNPGQYSEVLKSAVGFHLIKVLAREVRPLSPQALLALQKQALAEWLRIQREQSTIQFP